jgi:hypothetical protein
MTTGEVIALIKAFGGGGSSGGGVLVVDADSNYALNKTYKEITDAVISVMRINNGDGNYSFQQLKNFGYDEHDGYYVTYGGDSFVTDSENGYPAFDDGGGA